MNPFYNFMLQANQYDFMSSNWQIEQTYSSNTQARCANYDNLATKVTEQVSNSDVNKLETLQHYSEEQTLLLLYLLIQLQFEEQSNQQLMSYILSQSNTSANNAPMPSSHHIDLSNNNNETKTNLISHSCPTPATPALPLEGVHITKPNKMKRSRNNSSSQQYRELCSTFRTNLHFDIKTVESFQREQDRLRNQPKRKRGRPKSSDRINY